jgi:general secretion pathway protein G
MSSQKNNKQSGFTILELLVIISIIALISSIAVFYLQNARIRARDTKRKADISQVQKALSLYFEDYGIYPPLAGGSPTALSDALFASSISGFMSRVPRDPLCASGTACNYQIQYDVTQTNYAIKIPYEGSAVCKVLSPYAVASAYFSGVPQCP